MHTAAYKVDVASNRRRRGNVPRHILFKGHSAYAWKSGFMHNISKMLSTDFDEFHPSGMVL